MFYSTQQREMLKEFNKVVRSSSFFSKLTELRYKSPKGYVDYDNVTFELAKLLTTYNEFYEIDFFRENFTHFTSLIIVEQAYQKGFRPYWLSPSLFDAFNNSNLPKKLTKFQRIIPIGLLFLPPKLINPDGQSVGWILFKHRLKKDMCESISLNSGTVEVEHHEYDSISWMTILEDQSQYAINHGLVMEENELILYNDSFYVEEEILKNSGKNTNTKSEDEFTQKINQILLQTLLYLQLQNDEQISEEVVTSSSRISPKKNQKQKLSKKQKLNPTIIGENYRIKKKSQDSQHQISQNSPITHWRSGHWRYQPYGSREKPQYKMIWIEPTLINS